MVEENTYEGKDVFWVMFHGGMEVMVTPIAQFVLMRARGSWLHDSSSPECRQLVTGRQDQAMNLMVHL